MSELRLAGEEAAAREEAPTTAEQVLRPEPAPRSRTHRRRLIGALGRLDVPGLLALVAASAALRLEGLGVSLWLDEGISIGIASHPLGEIPALLVQDGSPPLYYLLLHGWMAAFGDSAVAVRSLSLVLALAMVPVAFVAGRSLFGRRAGWMAAVLAATSPYLSYWGREARMYTLLALLSLVAVTAFLHVFALRRRGWLPVLVVSLTSVLYTHNWGAHLVVAALLATAGCWVVRPDRHRVVIDAVVAFGGAAVLYAPWVPTLLSQLRHTGAPWSLVPVPREAVSAVGSVLGDERVLVALLVAASAPLVRLALRWHTGEGRSAGALAVLCGATVASAWTVAQFAPGWSSRYFGIFLAPLLLATVLGLSRGGATGLVAFALIIAFWTQPLGRISGLRPVPPVNEKSNVSQVAEEVVAMAHPGDLVISTQLEHVPVLRYYFGDDLRYATPLGVVPDPGVVDWRDALARLQAATPETGLKPLLAEIDRGDKVFLVCPLLTTGPDAIPWFRTMDLLCRSWRSTLDADPTMALRVEPFPPLDDQQLGSAVSVTVYEKVS
ncbi:MAG TPA: glycosyltransferase family 39 protein [Acidimicrobiales bacterium]|nr:glycosyltransferase family 39 protein [Acidimicrobiales bacterium]